MDLVYVTRAKPAADRRSHQCKEDAEEDYAHRRCGVGIARNVLCCCAANDDVHHPDHENQAARSNGKTPHRTRQNRASISTEVARGENLKN